MKRLSTLLRERYKVISELGSDSLQDILNKLYENQKRIGHCDYWDAIKRNHLDFFKDVPETYKKILKVEWRP